MASFEEMQHCPSCHRTTLFIRPATQHLFHAVMTLLTSGSWLFIWALCAWDAHRKAACTSCGYSIRDRKKHLTASPRRAQGAYVRREPTLELSHRD
jgi:hypothetical protein